MGEVENVEWRRRRGEPLKSFKVLKIYIFNNLSKKTSKIIILTLSGHRAVDNTNIIVVREIHIM